MSNDPIKCLQIITKDDQIKGYAHPTRMVLLKILAKEKRTISSVARELRVHPANITHHFKLLEKCGLIRLVEKRDTGKNLEKYYRAIAYAFSIDSGSGSRANKKALALSILKDNLGIAVMNAKDDRKEMVALLATARINRNQALDFIAELKNLTNSFKAMDSKDGVAYTVNISLYANDVDYLVNNKIELK